MPDHTCDRVEQLTKIETKIDKLADMLITVARQDERIENLEDRQEIFSALLEKFDTRLQSVERAPGDALIKFAWVILAGLAGFIFGKL